MKVITILLAISFLAVSCSSSKKSSATNKTVSSSKQAVDNTNRDGSDYEKAIIIDKTNENDGVAAEYKWLREHYPGYTMVRQSLKNKDNKPYDVLSIKTKDGENKDVYFDISNFFGKF